MQKTGNFFIAKVLKFIAPFFFVVFCAQVPAFSATCDAGYAKNVSGECVSCGDGYTIAENGNCAITCQAGYFVETPGGQCIKITEKSTYTDAPHTITHGETSGAYLKQCPRTADGKQGYIPDAWEHNSIIYCVCDLMPVRITQYERYGFVNCTRLDIRDCNWVTHGAGKASCYYTTGPDGAAIYDNQIVDPATGESRMDCVGSSHLTECDAGYYAPYIESGTGLQRHPCNPVGTAYWSPDKDLNRYECPAGTATCGVGECADSADDCMPYKKLKIDGFGDVLLWPVKRSKIALAALFPDGNVYYGMTTPVKQSRGLHIQATDGKVHTVLSPTDSFVTFSHENWDGTILTDILMFDEKE